MGSAASDFAQDTVLRLILAAGILTGLLVIRDIFPTGLTSVLREER